MVINLNKIKKFLGIDGPHLSLENKFFNVVCFTVSLNVFISIFVNIFLHFPLTLIFIELAIAICTTIGFLYSRFKKYDIRLALFFVFFAIIAIIPAWFLNGGVAGSTTHSGIAFIGFILVLLPTRYHWFFIVLLATVFFACFQVEIHFPYLVHVSTEAEKQSDLIFSGIINIFIIGILISSLKRIHLRDKAEIIGKNNELETYSKSLSLAKDKAEKEKDIKTNFLSSMSHEIRTPLNGVIGITELLSDTELSAEQQELIEMLHSSSSLLVNIVSDILDLSKMEVGQFSLNLKESNIKNCVESAMKISTSYKKFAKKDIQINYHIASNVATLVWMDESRVQQILINLLSNAIKFTREGSVIVEVSVRTQTATMLEVVFSVKDTGIGIKKEALTDLFQPFSQITNNFSQIYNGTGLGLFICKKLVELMGGAIWAESVENQGSNFSFKLPLKIVEASSIE
jgi:signal transduction histidine kinase